VLVYPEEEPADDLEPESEMAYVDEPHEDYG